MAFLGEKNKYIGVPQSGYNVQRNILGSLPDGWIRLRPVDIQRLKNAIRFRLTKEINYNEYFSFREPYVPRVDLLHFFSSISYSKTPWIVTVENNVPRWNKVDSQTIRKGYDCLLKDNCKKIIAFSESAQRSLIKHWNDDLPSSEVDVLQQKTTVLLSPQHLFSTTIKPSLNYDVPNFCFIGTDFFRKGGLEMLQAFERLYDAGNSLWKLIVIGDTGTYGDYASQTTIESKWEADRLIAKMSKCVQHFVRMPYSEVLKVLEKTLFFVFPTFADTFGYAVLEAQAHGCMVITTNVRSLPEIVDNQSGIILELPICEIGDAHHLPGFIETKKHLVDQLEIAFLRCCQMPLFDFQQKIENAFTQLKKRHDVGHHRSCLNNIYNAALER